MESDALPNARTADREADFSTELNRSIQELHHLVEVYHEHGHSEEAEEIYRTIVRIRGRLSDRPKGGENGSR